MGRDLTLFRRLRIEPLDRKKHDRAAFSCGVDRIDNFLRHTAGRHQDEDLTRVYVCCLDNFNTIVGYYAINAHSIDASVLPAEMSKKLPRYPSIPSIYLSIVGIQAEYQRQGIGTFLMADAISRCSKAADVIGAYFIVLDSLNENSARMYRRLGFIDLPGHEPRMILNMAQVRKGIRKSKNGSS